MYQQLQPIDQAQIIAPLAVTESNNSDVQQLYQQIQNLSPQQQQELHSLIQASDPQSRHEPLL